MTILVLSRKPGEVIRIGDAIIITVIGVDRGRVRLAIEAPKDVRIYRQERPRGEISEVTS